MIYFLKCSSRVGNWTVFLIMMVKLGAFSNLGPDFLIETTTILHVRSIHGCLRDVWVFIFNRTPSMHQTQFCNIITLTSKDAYRISFSAETIHTLNIRNLHLSDSYACWVKTMVEKSFLHNFGIMVHNSTTQSTYKLNKIKTLKHEKCITISTCLMHYFGIEEE